MTIIPTSGVSKKTKLSKSGVHRVFCVCFPAGWVHVLSHIDLRQPGTIAERILIEQYIGTSGVVRVSHYSLFEKPRGPPPEGSFREDHVITENEAREVLELAREV